MEKVIKRRQRLTRGILLVAAIAVLISAGILIAHILPKQSDDNNLQQGAVTPQNIGANSGAKQNSSGTGAQPEPGAATASDNGNNAGDKTGGNNIGSAIKVFLKIECETILGLKQDNGIKIPKGGVIKKLTSLSLPAGATVEDALEAIDTKFKGTYGYVSSIGEVPAGGFGKDSAWFYSINGSYPEDAYNARALKNGDRLTWRYSTDGGKDIGVVGDTWDEFSIGLEDEEPEDLSGEPVISGTITNEENEPLREISVTSWRYDEGTEAWVKSGTVISNSEGEYWFTGLKDGEYRLCFEDEACNYLTQYWFEQYSFDDADSVLIEDGEPAIDIDTCLIKASSISGTVTDILSAPLYGIKVTLFISEAGIWTELNNTTTDGNGRYRLAPLKAGEYTLAFSDPANNYFEKYWGGTAELPGAEVINLAYSERIENPGIALEGASRITGFVKDSEALPVSDASVKLYAVQAPPASPLLLREVKSDASGRYNFEQLDPGSYLLEVVPTGDAYIPEVYYHRAGLETADAIKLTAGETREIDFALQSYVVLSGVVKDQDGQGIDGVNVSVIGAGTTIRKSTLTAGDGSFSFSLMPGMYIVLANDSTVAGYDSGYESIYYYDSPAMAGAEVLSLSILKEPESLLIVLRDAGTFMQKTVSFVTPYGDSPPMRYVEYGARIGTLPVLEYPGYTFLGWYDAETGGQLVLTTFRVTADTTVYASWIKNGAITISFNSYGGSTVSPVSKTAGAPVGALPKPVYADKEFAGWYTSMLGNGIMVSESTAFYEDTTLFAYWKNPADITISFNSTGGSEVSPWVMAPGSKLIFVPSPVRPGYEFTGWYSQETGGSKLGPDHIYISDQTVYAQWALAEGEGDQDQQGDDDQTVTKKVKSSNAYLKKLTTSKGKLKPKFKKTKLKYSVKLPKNKKTVKIKAVKSHKSAKVYMKKAGSKYKKVSSLKIKLKKGKKTTVYIKVVAENGKKTKIYKVKVTRKK